MLLYSYSEALTKLSALLSLLFVLEGFLLEVFLQFSHRFSDTYALQHNVQVLWEVVWTSPHPASRLWKLWTSTSEERLHESWAPSMLADTWWTQSFQWRWHLYWLTLLLASGGFWEVAFLLHRSLLLGLLIAGWGRLVPLPAVLAPFLLTPAGILWGTLPVKEALLFSLAGVFLSALFGSHLPGKNLWIRIPAGILALAGIFYMRTPYGWIFLIGTTIGWVLMGLFARTKFPALRIIGMMILLFAISFGIITEIGVEKFLQIQSELSSILGRFSCSFCTVREYPTWHSLFQVIHLLAGCPGDGLPQTWTFRVMLAEVWISIAWMGFALWWQNRVSIVWDFRFLVPVLFWIILLAGIVGITIPNWITAHRYISPVLWIAWMWAGTWFLALRSCPQPPRLPIYQGPAFRS